jgi:hypothetical protein
MLKLLVNKIHQSRIISTFITVKYRVMGRQKDMYFSGTVENIIFYQRNGVGFIRTKPAVVKQTKATKKSASVFGQATVMGGSIRQLLEPLLPNPKDRVMQHQLRNALQQWLHHQKDADKVVRIPLQGLELNNKCNMQQLLKANLTTERTDNQHITLNIPAINPSKQMQAPVGTAIVEWQIMAIGCSLKNNTEPVHCSITHSMTYTNLLLTAAALQLSLAKRQNSLVLVVLAFNYLTASKRPVSAALKWKPAAIVGILAD